MGSKVRERDGHAFCRDIALIESEPDILWEVLGPHSDIVSGSRLVL